MKFFRLMISLLFLAGTQVTLVTADPLTQQGSTTLFLPIIFSQNSASPGWIGPDGGSILGLAVDPQNSNTVYAGTFGAGMFKSMDGGANWYPINNGLPNPRIQSFVIDPTNTSVLYTGTYRDETGSGYEGIYKSTDAGQTWVRSSTGIQDYVVVYSIAIDPTNSSRIYITTRGRSHILANSPCANTCWNGKVYRSVDAGSHWTSVPSMSNIGGYEDWVFSITVHPQFPGQIFAAAHENGPWYSRDYGVTWSRSTSGINSNDLNGRSIAVDPQSGTTATVYFGVWKDTPGVYRSTDGGLNWLPIRSGLNGATVYGLTINPLSPAVLFMSSFSSGVYKTINYGNLWSQSGLILNKLWIVSLAESQLSTAFAGTFGDGVYKSTDAGSTWAHAQMGIRNAWISGIVSVPGSSTEMFVSLNGGGILHTSDGGQTWIEFNTGLPDLYINGLMLSPDGMMLYALTNSHGLFRRLLPSSGWVPSAPNLPESAQLQPTYPEDHPFATWESLESNANPADSEDVSPQSAAPSNVALIDIKTAPSDSNIMYLGTEGSGVYRSADGGVNWVQRGLSTLSVWNLAIDPTNPDRLYAATNDSGAIKTSSNGGLNWTDLAISGWTVYALTIRPSEPGTLFAGTDSGVYAWNGSTWTQKGLSAIQVSALAAHPTIPGIIIAGTVNGAYYSSDGGNNWYPGSAALAGLTIQSINVNPASGMVYYGTTTRGVYKDLIP